MYTGVYKAKMDDKGRITLPQGIFSDIDDDAEFALIWAGDHCRLYIKEVWEEVLGRIPMKLKRLLCKYMHTSQADKHRRLCFPLRVFIDAGGGSKLVLVGCGDHYKIYTREAWEEVKDEFVGGEAKTD